MTWEDELKRCPLAAGPFPPDARRCDWCGEGLTGRRRRWCSDACSNAYSTNHAWTSARAAALARDRVCQRCGSDGHASAFYWFRFLEAVCTRPRFPHLLEWCKENGYYPDHVEARDLWRAHVRRLERPWEEGRRIMWAAQRRAGLEVNHIDPCLGAHKDNSCAHHLDGETARGLQVRVEVADGAPESVDVVSEQPEASVAAVAEQASDRSGLVVVVYVRDDFGEASFADGTRVPLLVEQRPEVLDLEPVGAAKVSGLAGASERAEPRVGSSLRQPSAEQAREGFLAAPSMMTSRAPLGAVEPLPARESHTALDTRDAGWRSLVGAGSAKAHVVPFADLAVATRGELGATLDLAGHTTILAVVGVPQVAMPRPRGGLEVLCHRCHVAETNRQRRAGLLRAS